MTTSRALLSWSGWSRPRRLCKRHAFDVWRGVHQWGVEQRVLIARTDSRRQHSALLQMWDTWRAAVDEAKRQQLILQRCSQRLLQRSLVLACASGAPALPLRPRSQRRGAPFLHGTPFASRDRSPIPSFHADFAAV